VNEARAIVSVGVLVGLAAAVVPARAQQALQARATVTPAEVRLGERAIYRGRVLVPPSGTYKWIVPDPGGDVTWGPLRPRLAKRRPSPNPPFLDTLEVEASVQVFRIGTITLPGLAFQAQDPGHFEVHRLPQVQLNVVSIMTAADSNADLRPVRGPIGAPWWERVPWTWVLAGLVLVATIVAAIVARLRRRRPAVVAVPRLDPAREALARLDALRRLGLPERGAFAEHAFELTSIVRRFLEATAQTPRPGDTTTELLSRLEGAALPREDFRLIIELLRAWDRVKFARVPSSSAEAHRAEAAVEAMLRRHVPAPSERAA
jgi:Domain of unknown function (DUF4381)